MMIFEEFARQHGLIMNSLVYDKWVATPTEDHPRSRNGRYKFLGNVGWVQNWATMEKPVTWFSDSESSSTEVRSRIKESMQKRDNEAQKAAKKAEDLLSQTYLDTHSYLIKKGFVNEEGNVLIDGDTKTLVIPMRIDGRLVGCQLINDEGGKKFLYGQTSKGATFVIGTKGTSILCEGYATGLSIRQSMSQTNIPYTIYVCFSASNMKFVSGNIGQGIIVADNDPNGVGETTAKETGKPYWLSETVGEDFNDYHRRVGNFKASQSLKKLLLSLKT
jgi:putative DNA primase/helicase